MRNEFISRSVKGNSSAVSGALARIEKITVNTPEVETFRDAEIIPDIVCMEPLDIIKSLPEFEGKSETYVSWRKAAHVAFNVFEKYEGSST